MILVQYYVSVQITIIEHTLVNNNNKDNSTHFIYIRLVYI